MPRTVLIVGAGVVGCSLARELAMHNKIEVVVLERGHRDALRGSTGYAPGFVGLYNNAPVLTDLAVASAAVYDIVGVGFGRTGGIEIATSAEGATKLARRASGARAVGLPVEELSPADLRQRVPAVVDSQSVCAAWGYPLDGAAEPLVLAAAIRAEAHARGARILNGENVTGICRKSGKLTVTTDSGAYRADDVVLAGGIWGPTLMSLLGIDLPLFPVAHPYVYSAPDASLSPGPFVRWPEHHVYARVHTDRIGIGSYDHAPVPVTQTELATGDAGLAWTDEIFSPPIRSAMRLLPAESRFTPTVRVNGVFAMTPDNLPLVGAYSDVPGLWGAQAVWVAHAGGVAAALTAAIRDDIPLPIELDPARFRGRCLDELSASALRLYRDIYANGADTQLPKAL
ncbi:NAD(P)/FAD-dependent oxidoreductase [Nocardia transvalensis]|uniref:NAD(P)/FAD-dependent oxidoreductase n=1 Tax=Nocardia transvalensis TaxID=37333 RepID=UPI00189634E5|nr:FAD-dependent oxidoreductase [Nocardia transvalensis]MBF6331846.1 FAD-binding oxidoreductase [Nocardia transvalensis]